MFKQLGRGPHTKPCCVGSTYFWRVNYAKIVNLISLVLGYRLHAFDSFGEPILNVHCRDRGRDDESVCVHHSHLEGTHLWLHWCLRTLLAASSLSYTCSLCHLKSALV
jgi:hypothetical protein